MKNELPKRPDGNDCDEIDDWVWETMMLGCWKDLPESRQNCDQILAALAAQDVDTSSSDEDKWKQTNLAFRRDMMNQLEDKVDYARVGKILTSVSTLLQYWCIANKGSSSSGSEWESFVF